MNLPSGSAKLKIFVSYSRRDAIAADELVEQLNSRGFEVTIDRRDLPFGEKWQNELADFIRQSDTVIWLISAQSIRSEWVNWELDEVARRNKRLVPIMIHDIPRDELPRQIGEIHILPALGSFDLRRDIETLVNVLETDRPWLKEASRLADRAHEWLAINRADALLLRGAALAAAELWNQRRPAKAPVPAPDILSLILASRQSATSRQRRWLVGSILIAIGAIALAGFAYVQTLHARNNLNEALKTESLFRAQQAQEATTIGVPAHGILLALDGMPDNASPIESRKARPMVYETERALLRALHAQRELRVFAGHESDVLSVAMTSDGARIVSASLDSAIVWDATSGRRLFVLQGQAAGTRSVAMTPDGARIVTGSNEGIAQIWDGLTGRELFKFRGHEGNVTSVATNNDGTLVVTGFQGGGTRLWSGVSGKELLRLDDGAEEGTIVAIAASGRRVVTGSGKVARVWDSTTGREITRLEGHSDDIASIALDRDGTRIVTGSNDNTARVWDGVTGKELRRLEGHAGVVSGVAVTPDFKRIVTGSEDASLRVWDSDTGRQLLKLEGHTGWIQSVAVTANGRRVLSGAGVPLFGQDSTARLWNASTELELLSLPPDLIPLRSLSASSNGRRIATLSIGDHVQIWNGWTGELELQVSGNMLTAAAIAPDGGRLVTGSSDGSVKVIETERGRELLTLNGHRGEVSSIAVSAGGTRIATGSADKTALVWDAINGKRILHLEGHSDEISSVSITGDGKRIVTGSKDMSVRVWDSESGSEIHRLVGHDSEILSTALSDAGDLIVTADLTAIKLWDGQSGKHLRTLEGIGGADSLAISEDGRRIASSSRKAAENAFSAIFASEQLNVVAIFDSMSGKLLLEVNQFPGRRAAVAMSTDGSRLVAGSESSSVKVWVLPHPGTDLVAYAKTRSSRCFDPEQLKVYLLPPTPPEWCAALEKWPYDRFGAPLESALRIRQGKDAEARLIRDARLKYDPDAVAAFDSAWTRVRSERNK